MKKEIAQYEADIKRLTGRSNSLSAKGAFLYPFSLFLLAFISSALSDLNVGGYAALTAGVALGSLIFGIIMLVNTLFVINEAATSPETLTAFRVSFASGSTVQRFACSQQTDVSIVVHNYGKEMAEEVMVHVNFPPGFDLIPKTHYTIFPQTSTSSIPGYTSANIDVGRIHESIMLGLPIITVTTPNKPGRYVVLVSVWEKRLGKSDYQLACDVA